MLARLTLVIALAAPSLQAGESAAFDLSFGGLRVGVLAYEASAEGGRYEMRGTARPSGLVRAFFDAEIDTVARGTVEANSYRPQVAREITREDGEVEEKLFRYAGGVPEVTRRPPREPRRHAAPAAAQAGTVDVTTAAFAILRDRPPELACRIDLAVYDGRRRHRIRLDNGEATAEGLTCTGRYSRVAGFDPEDLAERRHWPLRMDYVAGPDGMLQVQRITFPTSYGTARLVRR